MPLFILAGDESEAERFRKEHGLSRKQAPSFSLEKTRGITIFPGEVIRCGSYYERPDLAEIEEEISHVTHYIK